MFKRIDHTAFVVRDCEASVSFYERLFGFKKYFEHGVPVASIEKIVYLKLGDTVIELIHVPDGAPIEGFHFCVESDDFDNDIARLKSAGVLTDTEPHPAGAREPGEEGWRRAVFLGPDGELIEVRG